MQRKIRSLFLLYFPFLLVISGCGNRILLEQQLEQQKESVMTLREAIAIGKKELKNRNYPFWNEGLLIEANNNNTTWNNHIKSSPSVLKNETVKKMKLGKNEYWAIYYCHKRGGKGGDAFVFIDRSTGKIMGVLLGK